MVRAKCRNGAMAPTSCLTCILILCVYILVMVPWCTHILSLMAGNITTDLNLMPQKEEHETIDLNLMPQEEDDEGII